MTHHTTADFWAAYRLLPATVQKLADANYELLRTDSRYWSSGYKV